MRHVNIVGTGTRPLRDLPGGETWNLNVRPHPTVLDRLTRSFQIHPRHGRTAGEDRWLAECPVTLYVRSAQDARKNPHAVVFPWADVPAFAPISSSYDAMMALALCEGFRSVYLTGADLQVGTLRERLVEHVSLAYWVGLAGGMGVRVEFAPGLKLLRHPYRYGLDYAAERAWGQRVAMAALRCDDLDDGGCKQGDRRVRGVLTADGRRPDRPLVQIRRKVG